MGYIVNKATYSLPSGYNPMDELPSENDSHLGDVYQTEDGCVWRYGVLDDEMMGGYFTWYELRWWNFRLWNLKLKGKV